MCALCQRRERDKQVAALLAQESLNFALTWIAFVVRSKTWLEKWHCRTVSLCTEHISWFLAHSCPKNATVTRFRCGAEHIPLVSARWKLGSLRQLSTVFSVSSVQERLVLLASQLLPSTLIGSNNVQVARLVMGCHECIRACLGVFLCISSQYSSKPSSGVGKW